MTWGRYFDVSILELGEGTFQVKSTAGDTHWAVMIRSENYGLAVR